MTGHNHLFAEITELADTISFRDASKVEVKGKRQCEVSPEEWKTRDSRRHLLHSGDKEKILSVGQLMKKGFKIFMKKITLYLKDSRGRAIARVEMGENIMFKLNLQIIKQKYLKINKEDKAWLWHMRFGHLEYCSIRNLVKKQSVQGLPNLDFENKFYEGCVIGKQTGRQFRKSKFSTTRPLELIHTDIYGPITPGSLSGKEYFNILSMIIQESVGCTSSRRNLRYSRPLRSSSLWFRKLREKTFGL
jgi:GAG-pre-integrase domain